MALKKTDALAVFFLYLLLYLAFGHIAAAGQANALILQCAFTLAAGALPFLYAALRRIPFAAFFRLGRFSLGLLAGALLCMAGAAILSGLAQALTAAFLGSYTKASAKALAALLDPYPLPLALIASAALPAFCEEALFRGLILSSLRACPKELSGFRGEGKAIFASALLFAAAHMDAARFAPAFISGLALSYVGCAAGSLVLPMIMHFFNNSAALILYFASQGSPPEGSSPFPSLPPAAFLLACALSLALIFAGARVIRRQS